MLKHDDEAFCLFPSSAHGVAYRIPSSPEGYGRVQSCAKHPPTDMPDLERFFNELAPRLEAAQALERELDAQLARRFNVLDYLRTDELGLSRIVADLLKPDGKHGQGATFLKILLDGCGLKDHAPLAAATAVEVRVEKTIENDRRLDIFVRGDDHCLAIENKPYAGDQPCQVRDYLEWLQGEDAKKYALIYLSPLGEPPSPDSVELTYLEGLSGDHFKIMPYCSDNHDDRGDGFDDYRPKYTLAEWLADCRKNCAVDRLCWFLRETEVFCKRKFGGRTVGDNEFKEVKDFVVSDDKRWIASCTVHDALPRIMEDVSMCFMKKVWEAWPDDYEYHDDIREPILHYYSDRKKSCLGLYRESWKSSRHGSGYRNEEKYTQIRLEAASGIDRWFIGIRSDNPQLTGKDQAGFRELTAELASALRRSDADRPGWVWWQWVEYRDWSALIPQIAQECEEGDGDVMRYFVNIFAKISKVAIPIIDRYEGA